MAHQFSENQKKEVLRKLLDGETYGSAARALGLTSAEVAQVWREYAQGLQPGATASVEHMSKGRSRLQELRRRIDDLEEEAARAEERRGRLQAEVQDPQAKKLGESDETALPRALREGAALEKGIEEKRRQIGSLDRRIAELQEQVKSGEEQLLAGRKAAEHLASLGMPPWELQSFVQRLAHTAQSRGVPAAQLREELLNILEMLDSQASLNGELESKRAALEQVEASLATRQQDADRISGALAGLRQEQEHMEHLLPRLRETSTTAIRTLGEEAAVAIREEAQLLRREMDSLLQQSLDVAKTAAAVDAEVRSKEWLKRLLDLIEGSGDLRPQEVRVLAHTILTTMERWLEAHPDSAPDGMGELVTRLVAKLREWRG